MLWTFQQTLHKETPGLQGKLHFCSQAETKATSTTQLTRTEQKMRNKTNKSKEESKSKQRNKESLGSSEKWPSGPPHLNLNLSEQMTKTNTQKETKQQKKEFRVRCDEIRKTPKIREQEENKEKTARKQNENKKERLPPHRKHSKPKQKKKTKQLGEKCWTTSIFAHLQLNQTHNNRTTHRQN